MRLSRDSGSALHSHHSRQLPNGFAGAFYMWSGEPEAAAQVAVVGIKGCLLSTATLWRSGLCTTLDCLGAAPHTLRARLSFQLRRNGRRNIAVWQSL